MFLCRNKKTTQFILFACHIFRAEIRKIRIFWLELLSSEIYPTMPSINQIGTCDSTITQDETFLSTASAL